MELRDWLELARIELRREEGQTMTEYGILLALIAVVVIVALLVLGPKIAAVFTNVAKQALTLPTGGSPPLMETRHRPSTDRSALQ